MPITSADLDASTIILSPMTLTDTTENLLNSIIGNIRDNKDITETFSEEAENKLNEIITTINNITAGNEVDIDGLSDSVKTIIKLQVGVAGSETFLEAFRVLERELDRRKTTNAFRTDVQSSPNGKFLVDVSAYGFASASDYTIIAKVPTSLSGEAISATCRVVSATQAEVTLRNEDVFQGKNISTSFYDASVEGELSVVLMVVHTANPVALTIDTSAFRLYPVVLATVTGWGVWYQDITKYAVEVRNPHSVPITARLLDVNYDLVEVPVQGQGLHDTAFIAPLGSHTSVKYIELIDAMTGVTDLWELGFPSNPDDFLVISKIYDAGRVVGVVPSLDGEPLT